MVQVPHIDKRVTDSASATRYDFIGERLEAFNKLIRSSEFSNAAEESIPFDIGMARAIALLTKVAVADGAVFIVGNGGSAAIASHIANDFCNTGGLRVATLHEAALLTCFTNDYGYENAYAHQLLRQARSNDLLVAISSSGSSPNIQRAAEAMTQVGGKVFTLSGFSPKNPLRRMGELNIWLNAQEFGMVETAHFFLLHHLADVFANERSVQHGK